MSRGMSWYKAQRTYEDLIKSQVDPKWWQSVYKDILPPKTAEQLKIKIDESAKLNGLDAEELWKQATTKVRSEYYSKLWQAVEKGKLKDQEKYAEILLELGVTSQYIMRSGRSRKMDSSKLKKALEAHRKAQQNRR